MKIATVREFRDSVGGLLRSEDPILVTRRDRLTGVFFPARGNAVEQDANFFLCRAMTCGARSRSVG